MGSRGQNSGTSNKGIATIIGRKNKSKTIDEAWDGTNPNYGKGIEYSINCQRCVIAYELRRRGYNVEALPYENNDGTKYWYKGFENQKWERLGATRVNNSIKLVKDEVKSWGNGARGFVYVVWKGRSSAHIFNVENHNGKVVFVDPQSKSRKSWVDIDHFEGSMPSLTMVSRVDNLKFKTTNLDKTVRKVGK